MEEIRQAVFSMGNYKSPSPDGMTVTFYKQYWSIVGEAVGKEVREFFHTGKLKTAFNHTFIALILKAPSAARVDQFRPIALCNVILKIITKILAGRLRPLLDRLIHSSQAAFIPNRAIGDNIIINHEVMHYLNTKKGKHGYLAIKIDLAKAFDRVEWQILATIFQQFGFQDRFIQLIQACITSAHFSVLLNGSPFGYFTAERGIRQGDPMSPALFTLFPDVLSRLLARSEAEGKLHGVKVSRTSPTISHLMYADDLVIYCKATEEEVREVHHCLQTYCQWTGQAINWGKSLVHFSRNVDS